MWWPIDIQKQTGFRGKTLLLFHMFIFFHIRMSDLEPVKVNLCFSLLAFCAHLFVMKLSLLKLMFTFNIWWNYIQKTHASVKISSFLLNWSSVFKASPRRQGGGGSPCLRSRLSPPRHRLGDKAVVDRLASPYRFKNIELIHLCNSSFVAIHKKFSNKKWVWICPMKKEWCHKHFFGIYLTGIVFTSFIFHRQHHCYLKSLGHTAMVVRVK